jgi:cytochrome b6-f complex iron-sulfur subunit
MVDETEPATTAAPDAAAPPGAPRPAAAKPAAPAAGEVSRRGFFSWAAVAWVGFAAAIGGCMTAFGRFMYPNVLFEPPTTFKVGRPENFPPGVVDERFKDSNGVWIVHLAEEGRIVALIAICTHLGCPPAWLDAQNKFKCPCHGSGYYRNGVNFEGPTPRPLERARIAVSPDDGQIVVDKAQKYLWEMGQWEDPSSYIAVG